MPTTILLHRGRPPVLAAPLRPPACAARGWGRSRSPPAGSSAGPRRWRCWPPAGRRRTPRGQPLLLHTPQAQVLDHGVRPRQRQLLVDPPRPGAVGVPLHDQVGLVVLLQDLGELLQVLPGVGLQVGPAGVEQDLRVELDGQLVALAHDAGVVDLSTQLGFLPIHIPADQRTACRAGCRPHAGPHQGALLSTRGRPHAGPDHRPADTAHGGPFLLAAAAPRHHDRGQNQRRHQTLVAHAFNHADLPSPQSWVGCVWPHNRPHMGGITYSEEI